MRQKMYLVLGVAAIIVALALNVSHAVDNYGLTKSSLSVKILAQDTGTGGTGTGSGGEGNGTDGIYCKEEKEQFIFSGSGCGSYEIMIRYSCFGNSMINCTSGFEFHRYGCNGSWLGFDAYLSTGYCF